MKNLTDMPPKVYPTADAASDAWRLGVMATEILSASLTTFLLRNWNWALNWPPCDPFLDEEGKRMVNEKISATMRVNEEWLRFSLKGWFLNFNPWRSAQKLLAPVHCTATANARRLMRP